VRFFLSFLFIFQCNVCLSQDSVFYRQAIAYSPEFFFSEGVYLSFKDFRDNDPISVGNIISSLDREDEDFLAKVLAMEEFRYKTAEGKVQKLSIERVWGYSRNGNIYVNIQNTFNRVPIIGKICHFVANVTTYVTTFNNSPFNGYGQGGMMKVPTTELKQLIIDYDSGKILDFNAETLEDVLIRDSALYKEFSVLSNRKKRDSLFIYLRKYNSRNPVYFPE
jgi:hypothetical protein